MPNSEALSSRGLVTIGLVATISLLSGAFVAASPLWRTGTSISASEETPTAGIELCDTASDLMKRGDPQSAVELIQSMREPALRRLDVGIGLPEDSELANTCEAEWNAALAAGGLSDTDAGTKPDLFPPLGISFSIVSTLIPWLFGWLLATFLVARLAAAVARAPWVLSTRARRVRWLVLGLCLSGASSIAMLFATIAVWPEAMPLFTLLWIGGCLYLAMWSAGRMRVSAWVAKSDGMTDLAAAMEFVYSIRKLGGEPPSGIEFAHGVDVSDLTQVVSVVSTSGLRDSIRHAIDTVFNVSPWRAELTSLSEHAAILVVARNGRHVLTELIDISTSQGNRPEQRQNITPSQAQTTLLQVAAAHVVVTLARNHPDLTGLYGASVAESIAAHFLATTSPGGSPDRSDRLNEAIRLDPSNLLAVTALQHITNSSDSARYLELLHADIASAALLSGLPDPLAAGTKRTGPTRTSRYPQPPLLLLRLLSNYVTAGRKSITEIKDRLLAVDGFRGIQDAITLPELAELADSGAIKELAELARKYDRTETVDPLLFLQVTAALERLTSLLTQHNCGSGFIIEALQMKASISARRLSELNEGGHAEQQKLSDRLAKLVEDTSTWWRIASDSTIPDVQFDLACYYARSSATEVAPTPPRWPRETPTLRALRLLEASARTQGAFTERALNDPELAPLREFMNPRDATPPEGIPNFHPLIGARVSENGDVRPSRGAAHR